MTHWRDWAKPRFWPTGPGVPRAQTCRFFYEKCGLVIRDEPIPWCAESAIVEVAVKMPAGVSRRRADFRLNFPDRQPIEPDQFFRAETSDEHIVSFRFPMMARSGSVTIAWRNARFAEISLPLLSCEDFIRNVRLERPTVFARIGEDSVACQTFVVNQCREVMAAGLLESPTSLAPVHDAGLTLDVRNERGEIVQSLPLRLTASQLASRQALVALAPRRFPRRIGTWYVAWMIAGRPLAVTMMRVISTASFHRSLRSQDARFIVQPLRGAARPSRGLLPDHAFKTAAPCFIVSSREPGMAGKAAMQIVGHPQCAGAPTVLWEDKMLITDGPMRVAPFVIDRTALGGWSGFELRTQEDSIAMLSTSPIPSATFTGEASFRPPGDYAWTPAADDELNDRLNRLSDDHEHS
jgi:hypothetical protein